MRFRESRPYAKELLANLQEAHRQKKVTPNIGFQTTTTIVAQALKKAGVINENSKPNSETLTLFTLESMEALAWVQWSISESQLYCFDNNLIEAFKNSSSLELTINNLRFPFEHFYFHFGTQKSMPLHDAMLFVEGAYVFFNSISLRIVLCGTWKEEIDNQIRPWYKRGNECYDLRIPSSNYDLPLEEAIENALQTDIEQLQASEQLLNSNKTSYTENCSSTSFIEAHIKNRESYKQALSLITNALCYLTAYPNDEKIMWENQAPKRLITLAYSDKPKEKIRASSKLKSLGFSIIHQVGNEFGEKIAQDKSKQDEHPSSRRIHWRRGHWRMQPYGANNSLRRLIWITPVRVGVKSYEEVSRIRIIT